MPVRRVSAGGEHRAGKVPHDRPGSAASAEIVIEGYVDPTEPWETEGPFGDHTGFYSLADQFPLFHVTAITHRANPIYPTTIVGKPPMEDFWMGKATERIFLPLIKMFIPELVDYNLP